MTKDGPRLANGPAETFDLNEILRTLVHSRQDECRRQDIAVILDLAPRLPKPSADIEQIENALFALFLNAEEAIVKSGNSNRMLAIRTLPDSGKIQISMSYAGIADGMRMVIDGLRETCLTMCARIVQNQGGELYIWRPRQSAYMTIVLDLPRFQ